MRSEFYIGPLENGIPPPEGAANDGVLRLRLRSMQVTQSFFTTCSYRNLWNTAAREGIRIMTRKEKRENTEGYRVWKLPQRRKPRSSPEPRGG